MKLDRRKRQGPEICQERTTVQGRMISKERWQMGHSTGVTRRSPHPESQGAKPTLMLNLSEGIQKQEGDLSAEKHVSLFRRLSASVPSSPGNPCYVYTIAGGRLPELDK